MNVGRFMGAVAALFLFIFAADWLVHSIWLRADYEATPYELWRPDPEMFSRAWWIMAAQALSAVAFAWIWAAWLAHGATSRRAAIFGLLMGLFRQSDALSNFAVHPYPGSLVAKWFFANILISVLMGLLLHAVYRPLPQSEPGPKLTPRGRTVLAAALLVFIVSPITALLYSWNTFQNVEPTAEWMAPLKTTWVVDSPRLPHSVRTSSDVQKDGVDSLRFELRGGDTFRDGLGRESFRAEVDIKEFPPMRSVRWYAFSVQLPADFPRVDDWLDLAQWHGVDKRHLGEPSRHPVMSMTYNRDVLALHLRHSPKRILEFEGDSEKILLFETREFPHARWHDFIVQAKWSFESDGFVNVWMNGEQIVRYRGPVGYNDDVGPYFRFGLYRGETDKTHTAYFNGVRAAPNPEELGLSPSVTF